MAQKFETVEQLTSVISKMTILQLRELARDFDVIPRNLPRDELIRRITASYNGEIEPEIRIKSGRPTKKVKLAQKQGIDDLYYSDASADNVDKNLPRTGILEVLPDGYGFVRTENYSSHPGRDYHMSQSLIAKMALRSGDKVKVVLHQFPDRNVPTAVYVQEINDQPCGEVNRVPFESMQACFPT